MGLDTSGTPVCPLFIHNVSSLKTVHMKRGFSGNQDQRGDSNEELSSTMGREGTDYQRYQCCGPCRCLLDLRGTRTRGARSAVIPSQPGRLCLIRIAEVVVIGKHTFSLQIRFSTNPTVCRFSTPYRSLLTTVV